MSRKSYRNSFKGFCIEIPFGLAHLDSTVPNSILHFFRRQTLAFMAPNGLEFGLDALADIHPKIWAVTAEKT